MDPNCVFCKIISGEIPSNKEKENDRFIVIHDVKPQAQLHLLIIPKKHMKDITEMEDSDWLGVKNVALEMAKVKDIESFRLVHNVGGAAMVKHAHVHMLGDVSEDRGL